MGPPMTNAEQKMLFMALGFLSVVMSDEVPIKKRARSARAMANLIEEFCHLEVPEAFCKGSEFSPQAKIEEDWGCS